MRVGRVLPFRIDATPRSGGAAPLVLAFALDLFPPEADSQPRRASIAPPQHDLETFPAESPSGTATVLAENNIGPERPAVRWWHYLLAAIDVLVPIALLCAAAYLALRP